MKHHLKVFWVGDTWDLLKSYLRKTSRRRGDHKDCFGRDFKLSGKPRWELYWWRDTNHIIISHWFDLILWDEVRDAKKEGLKKDSANDRLFYLVTHLWGTKWWWTLPMSAITMGSRCQMNLTQFEMAASLRGPTKTPRVKTNFEPKKGLKMIFWNMEKLGGSFISDLFQVFRETFEMATCWW